MQIMVSDVKCPHCGAGEMHPNGETLLVRAFKVQTESGYWWSQCLVCAGYYDKDLNETRENFDPSKGWF